MQTIRMRTDLAEEGMSIPAGKSFWKYDCLIDIVYLSAEELEGAVLGDDPAEPDDHAFRYVELRDGRCFYMVGADLDY